MAQVSRQDLVAPAGTRDLLYTMSEEQVNHERTAIRSCGPCLTNVFINDLCVCVCVCGGGEDGELGGMLSPREAGRQAAGRNGGMDRR